MILYRELTINYNLYLRSSVGMQTVQPSHSPVTSRRKCAVTSQNDVCIEKYLIESVSIFFAAPLVSLIAFAQQLL